MRKKNELIFVMLTLKDSFSVHLGVQESKKDDIATLKGIFLSFIHCHPAMCNQIQSASNFAQNLRQKKPLIVFAGHEGNGWASISSVSI